MNGETISVLTWVSQAVNACVNLPAQTVLGLWSHRMADGEHSLLAAATLPFHNSPWCHVQTYGKPRRNIALLDQPDPLLTGHCVLPSPAPNIWCNWENCFIFLWKICLCNPAKLCCLFLQCWVLHMLKSAIIHPQHRPGKQCKSKKSGGFPVVPGVYSQLAVTDAIWAGSGLASTGRSQGSTCWHDPGVAAQMVF